MSSTRVTRSSRTVRPQMYAHTLHSTSLECSYFSQFSSSEAEKAPVLKGKSAKGTECVYMSLVISPTTCSLLFSKPKKASLSDLETSGDEDFVENLPQVAL